MDISLSQVAEITLFITNAAVMIISIGTYWRMTRYEQSNHLHIVNALRETRDAGLEMKVAAHELLRTVHGDRGGSAGASVLGQQDMQTIEELTQLVRQLLDSRQLWSDDPDPEPHEREPIVHWPSHAKDMSNELMTQLQQRHKSEVDRLLAQRRRTQQELDATRLRLEDINKLLNAMRLRVAQHAQVDVNGLKSKLENTRHQAQELQLQLEGAKMRALEAETKLARAQQSGHAGASKEADKAQAEQFQAMAEEVAQRSAQLAEANRTIAKLREDLQTLASPQEAPAEADEWRESRDRMEREIAQLKTRTDELQDALKRNLVEKEFIEEHYLKEAQRNRSAAEPPGPSQS